MIDNPEIPLPEMEDIESLTFPTAGHIHGKAGIYKAYETGRGKVIMRGNVHFEEMKNGKWSIIIDELPFQVNKARLVEDIANLVKQKKVDGITALRDESDRKGCELSLNSDETLSKKWCSTTCTKVHLFKIPLVSTC